MEQCTSSTQQEKRCPPTYHCAWDEVEYLATAEGLSYNVAKATIELLNEEYTIPFIARYRSDLTGGLPPDKLRKIKLTFEHMRDVQQKAAKLFQVASESDNEYLFPLIEGAQTLEELDFLGAPFKKDGKKTLAQRARKLGLDRAVKFLLENDYLDFNEYVSPENPDLDTVEKVSLGIQHIVADDISKNVEVRSFLDKISKSREILLQSKFSRKLSPEEAKKSKYNNYEKFSMPVATVKPHQTLAINRGESEKELSVKVVIPVELWTPLINHVKKKWIRSGSSPSKTKMINNAIMDAIKRLLNPLLVRQIRRKLTETAENEAIKTFETNLIQLLMMRPYYGHIIMGIDPGFKNGCKMAVISQTGEPLAYDKFYLARKTEATKKIANLINKYKCKMIALGNGVGCRETETLITRIIQTYFSNDTVEYTIISEQALSIYSCSPMASEEFPDLDPVFVSSISLARRLQNPLSELVKVEPKHLGVGMYQHDVNEKKLENVLDEIVSECVSFVGVDVNTASFYLLKRVAGLNKKTAQAIINYRSENCTFKSRSDLMKVKGIKNRTFQQCVGFIRIISATARCDKHRECQTKFNPLDETGIHPESYGTTLKFIQRLGLNVEHLGTEEFVNAMKDINFDPPVAEIMAKEYNCSTLTMTYIISTLKEPRNYDIRSGSTGPIFRKEVKTIDQISPGNHLEGVVRNITPFGAFVDIGVGKDGLLYVSEIKDVALKLNDRIQVKVLAVDSSTERISLKLIARIQNDWSLA